MSSEADYDWLIKTMPSSAVGITLCSGSLGVRAENDLPGMMQRLGKHVHFLHLRNVRLETMGEKISFHEAEHLDGETDMVALIGEILKKEARRSSSIPFRPDHG
jgi:mannonate dehydratase